MKQKAIEIADRIEGRLKKGVRLGGEVVHYIESVAGVKDPNELFHQLEDSESCDSQSLYELVFYPAEADQIELEPILESETLEPQDTQTINSRLISKKISTEIIYPDESSTPPIRIPENTLRQYVQRLNLTRRIPEKLADSINSNLHDRSAALRLRVWIRNTRFGLRENIVSFLCTYMEQLPVETREDLEQLAWTLDFLDQTRGKTDIYSALMEEKQRISDMIRQASESDKRLSRLPVEAIIMQGVNIPSLSSEKAMKRVRMIDTIAISIFGKTETPGQLAPINLGDFNPREDLDRIIKILS